MAKKKRAPNSKMARIVLSEDLYERLEEEALREQRPISAMGRLIIQQYLDRIKLLT